MLARCRGFRFVRFALAAGALFSVGLTLGLHPEPPASPSRPGLSADSGAAPSHGALFGDGCVACRAQNGYAIPDLGAPGPILSSFVTAVALRRDAAERSLTRPSHEGRAPPVLA